MSKIIELKNVNKWFDKFQALKDINLEVNQQEKIVICGPSGSGKSTLIRCINRLEEHQDGQIIVDGNEISENTKDLEKIRAGNNIYLSELIATFGLLLVIAVVSVKNATAIAPAVGLYITAGYWFTSSTSFANPAVSIARSFTNTFTGISPENILNFIIMQILAVFIVYGTTNILLKD